MKKLVLPDSLLTGHAGIDAEHNKLVGLINTCMDAVEREDEGREEKIKTALLELANELRRHFKREEKIMEGLGYKNMKKHRNHHNKTLEDFDKISDVISNEALPIEWALHTIIHSFISDVVVPDFNFKNYLIEIDYRGLPEIDHKG